MGMLLHHTWLNQQKADKPVKAEQKPVEKAEDKLVEKVEGPVVRKPGRRKTK